MRDIEKRPYTADETRVARYFADRGTGGGDDPIGAMLAGYAWAVEQRNQYRAALEAIAKEQSASTAFKAADQFQKIARDALAVAI